MKASAALPSARASIRSQRPPDGFRILAKYIRSSPGVSPLGQPPAVWCMHPVDAYGRLATASRGLLTFVFCNRLDCNSDASPNERRKIARKTREKRAVRRGDHWQESRRRGATGRKKSCSRLKKRRVAGAAKNFVFGCRGRLSQEVFPTCPATRREECSEVAQCGVLNSGTVHRKSAWSELEQFANSLGLFESTGR